jgi:hypothetical protein
MPNASPFRKQLFYSNYLLLIKNRPIPGIKDKSKTNVKGHSIFLTQNFVYVFFIPYAAKLSVKCTKCTILLLKWQSHDYHVKIFQILTAKSSAPGQVQKAFPSH